MFRPHARLNTKCYHSFCAHCLQDRVEDGKVSCPLCGSVTVIKEGNSLPPPDTLLKFLVESSSGDTILCANCDSANVEMFYCKTCNQPLCLSCREETHRAKMFSKHEVVLHTKHTRDIQKDCRIHGEPYILFSTEKKIMLCINCFRDMKVESRSHCVDLETAYKQGCQKIDDTMQSIRDLQSSVRTGILLLQALLDEIKVNADKEKQDISNLYDEIQEKIIDTKQTLLHEIDRQFIEKEELFKNQLVSLRTFLPTLHVHLVACTAFCSSTNKYEFLGFIYEMMKRLTAIIQVQQPLHPSQTSEIITEYKTKLARCLEPLLFPPRNGMNAPVSMATSVSGASRFEQTPTITTMAASLVSCKNSHNDERSVHTRQLQNKKKLKLKLMENKGFFADHCKSFDGSHRELMAHVDKLKQSVQELQRDITLRRSLTKDLTVCDLKTKISEVEERLDCHLSTMEGKQSDLEKHWEESLEMIAAEQEVYQAQIQDIDRLKIEVCSVKTILQKLTSFMSSIANVTQRLAPKLGKANTLAEHESKHNAILQKINEMQPDSQQRVDAIRTAEEERDIKTANRTNPLDEELIKTKGLLRAPSARRDPAKRLSAEIKEMILDTTLKATDGSSRSSDGSPKVSDGSPKTSEGSPKTSDGSPKTSDGSPKTSDGSPMSNDGSPKSVDGSPKSKDGDKAASKINDLDIKGSSDLDTKGSEESDVRTDESPGSDAIVVLDYVTPSEEINTVLDMNISVLTDSLDSEKLDLFNQPLPDVMVHMKKASESSTTLEDNEGTSSSIVSITSESDSEMDCSLDSSVSEENVRPGHVKDLIAKVVGFSKGAEFPAGGNVSPVGPKSPVLVDKHASDTVDDKSPGKHVEIKESATKPVENSSVAEYDRVNRFVALEGGPKSGLTASNESACTVANGNNVDKQSSNGNDEETYVSKSLPELAQVFEQGEIKSKKRKGKTDKRKAHDKDKE
ncbi:hypothetical protein ACF0H5_022695 [Mactra antiquata]